MTLKNTQDVWFKKHTKKHINEILDFLGYNLKIVKELPNELIYKNNEYAADFVGLTDNNKIINLEFQSTSPKLRDSKRFHIYSFIINHYHNLDVKTIILSTPNIEANNLIFSIGEDMKHIMFHHNLTNYDGDKIFDEIQEKEDLTKTDISNLQMIPLMNSEHTIEYQINKVIDFICDLNISEEEKTYYLSGQIQLAEKFLKDKEALLRLKENTNMKKLDIAEIWKESYIEEGKIEGKIEGKAEEKYEIVKNLLKENVPLDIIMKVSNLSLKEINTIKD